MMINLVLEKNKDTKGGKLRERMIIIIKKKNRIMNGSMTFISFIN